MQGISSANGLSGDEFKSLGENATQVLRNIARGLKELNTFEGFDGTISALRKLGSEGKLTADVVVPALARVADQVDADFAVSGLRGFFPAPLVSFCWFRTI